MPRRSSRAGFDWCQSYGNEGTSSAHQAKWPMRIIIRIDEGRIPDAIREIAIRSSHRVRDRTTAPYSDSVGSTSLQLFRRIQGTARNGGGDIRIGGCLVCQQTTLAELESSAEPRRYATLYAIAIIRQGDFYFIRYRDSSRRLRRKHMAVQNKEPTSMIL